MFNDTFLVKQEQLIEQLIRLWLEEQYKSTHIYYLFISFVSLIILIIISLIALFVIDSIITFKNSRYYWYYSYLFMYHFPIIREKIYKLLNWKLIKTDYNLVKFNSNNIDHLYSLYLKCCEESYYNDDKKNMQYIFIMNNIDPTFYYQILYSRIYDIFTNKPSEFGNIQCWNLLNEYDDNDDFQNFITFNIDEHKFNQHYFTSDVEKIPESSIMQNVINYNYNNYNCSYNYCSYPSLQNNEKCCTICFSLKIYYTLFKIIDFYYTGSKTYWNIFGSFIKTYKNNSVKVLLLLAKQDFGIVRNLFELIERDRYNYVNFANNFNDRPTVIREYISIYEQLFNSHELPIILIDSLNTQYINFDIIYKYIKKYKFNLNNNELFRFYDYIYNNFMLLINNKHHNSLNKNINLENNINNIFLCNGIFDFICPADKNNNYWLANCDKLYSITSDIELPKQQYYHCYRQFTQNSQQLADIKVSLPNLYKRIAKNQTLDLHIINLIIMHKLQQNILLPYEILMIIYEYIEQQYIQNISEFVRLL